MGMHTKVEGKEKVHTRFGKRLRVTRGPNDLLRPDDPPRPTKQADKADADINNIMKRFETTGELPNLIKADPTYGDFSSPVDFQEALHLVHKAQEQFEALPAQVRARFENDPSQFLAFATDTKNADELVKMGLAEPRPPKDAGQPPASPTGSKPQKGGSKGEASAAAEGGDA